MSKKDKYIESMGKNIKPYGAIRELEEFLDPNVLKDDDFQIL